MLSPKTTRLASMLEAIDTCNRHDPSTESWQGQTHPKAWLYGQRMSEALARFDPHASEELQIAARAQHIERWTIPRSDYPATRVGYLQWRKALGQFHAARTAGLMSERGYADESINMVTKLLTKRGIKQDPQVQTLEDVICLVFVEFYLLDFAADKDPGKLADIVRKTWAKMSDRGHEAILALPLAPQLRATLLAALAGYIS